MTVTQNAAASPLRCLLGYFAGNSHVKDAIQVRGLPEQDLDISFQRTIRVPDGRGDSELPPSMGTFPLYSVAHHKNKLPEEMALKGGLFFPMYRQRLDKI